MKPKLQFSLLLIIPAFCFSQSATFTILPFLNGVTSIKDGLIEAGPELAWKNKKADGIFVIRPSVRIPLTNKNDNAVQIDRFSTTWRGILAIQYTFDHTASTGPISRNSLSLQGEYGNTLFKYYPTGNKLDEHKESNSSQAYELKYVGFFTKGAANAKQISPQVRIRYSKEWKASDEVGVVNPVNGNGVVTTTNMVIDKPILTPVFSPAVSIQYYSGHRNFSYSSTLYYDFSGKKGGTDPFNSLARIRIESWVFYYPLIAYNSNVKIGLTPTLSIRTKGTDKFNGVEYGGQVSIKFGTSFLQFL